MKFYTFDTKKQRKVKIGDIQGTALFKTVDPSKHFMRVVDGYGIQYNAFIQLEDKGVKSIIIKETTGNQWEADLETWKNHSLTADYGSGKQVFLSMKYMKAKKRILPQPFTKATYEPTVKNNEQIQEKLF